MLNTEKQAEDALLAIEHLVCILGAPRRGIAGVEGADGVRLAIGRPEVLASHRGRREQLRLQR